MQRRRLVLVREVKLASLLPDSAGRRLEASGVLGGEGRFYVIFDNAPDIGRIGPELSAGAAGNGLIGQDRGRRSGLEDIAHDAAAGRFFVLVEARARRRGFMAEVQEYDQDFAYLGRAWLDFPLDGPNKGLEGLTCVRRQDRSYLLGLCEGNRCRDGEEGRRPGVGGSRCSNAAGATGTVSPPSGCRRRCRSRTSAAWPLPVTGWRWSPRSRRRCGSAASSRRAGSWPTGERSGGSRRIRRGGPSTATSKGSPGCRPTGSSWYRVVVVSDRAKRNGRQDECCRAKDQSIHVFTIPGLG
jgi:hypothetical protein